MDLKIQENKQTNNILGFWTKSMIPRWVGCKAKLFLLIPYDLEMQISILESFMLSVSWAFVGAHMYFNLIWIIQS